MTPRQIVPLLAILAQAGCGGNGAPEHAAINTGNLAATPASGPSRSIGFIGADGLQVAATAEINHALETALTNHPASWTDAESGTVTQFVALRTFQTDDNTYCRDFSQTVTKGSDTETARGVACRASDGTWRAVPG